jgi:hypothetical protein
VARGALQEIDTKLDVMYKRLIEKMLVKEEGHEPEGGIKNRHQQTLK